MPSQPFGLRSPCGPIIGAQEAQWNLLSPLWQPLTVAGKLMSKHFAQSASETTCESHKAGSKSWSRSRKGTSTGSYYLWWISPWNGLISSTVHQKNDMNSAPKPIDWWLYGLILILFNLSVYTVYNVYIYYVYIYIIRVCDVWIYIWLPQKCSGPECSAILAERDLR